MPVINVEKPLREKLGEEATTSQVNIINRAQTEQKTAYLNLSKRSLSGVCLKKFLDCELRLSNEHPV